MLTLARHLPARFDFGVEAQFETMGKLRLAQQVRQDMWRALRDVRGFSPVVHVEEQDHGLRLRAGAPDRPAAALAPGSATRRMRTRTYAATVTGRSARAANREPPA